LYDLTIATGNNARTLIIDSDPTLLTPRPPTLPIRKRSRSQLDTDTWSGSGPIERKRASVESRNDMITAINRSIEARKSNIVKAIEILASQYQERLSEDDFGVATDLLTDESKAAVFVTLPSINLKDKWLVRQTGVVLFIN